MNTDHRQLLNKQNQLLDNIKANTGGSTTAPSDYQKLLSGANDLVQTYTWLDGGTDDQRISTIVYSSISLGLTVTETFTYNGGAGTYHVATSTLS